ncbi:hypothetical protein D3C80_1686140 [compost metagenome]
MDSVRWEIDVIALNAVTIMTSKATASSDKHTSRRDLIVMGTLFCCLQGKFVRIR